MPSYRPQTITTCSQAPRRRASDCVKRLPCGDVSTTVKGRPRSASIVSSARKIGSGFSTIPGPPPYGTSSTTRWRSVVKSRKSRTLTSSVPRSIARPSTPAASGSSIMAGKIVTMSKVIAAASRSGRVRLQPDLVHLEQTLGRVDLDPLDRRIDDRADVRHERNQHFSFRAVDHQPAARHRALDVADEADCPAVPRFHPAPNQV